MYIEDLFADTKRNMGGLTALMGFGEIGFRLKGR